MKSPAALPSLSIETRLNLLIGALLVLALAGNVLAIIWSAGPRIGAENASILRLTRQTVERSLSGIGNSADPARDIANLLDRLTDIRHARVMFEPLTPGFARASIEPPEGLSGGVPHWFAALVSTERPPVRIPVNTADKRLGTLVIAPNPGDEIAEIWAAVTETATTGLALIAAVFALTTLAVRQALMPIHNLGRALSAMQGGNYGVELATTGPPELAGISGKVNDLAEALTRTTRENSRLTGEIISIEDRERRELARELHDEFGPYLFAIRANITALQAIAGRAGTPPDKPALAAKCEAALDQIGALQQVNRRVLQRLRPPALAELGLDGALRGLVAQWRENHPSVTIALDTVLPPSPLDETAQLTVYRVVQEGLTNAFRHANASHIAVGVECGTNGTLHLSVQDDGTGLTEGSRPGFGLSGMEERVWALGGTMKVTNSPTGGLRLDVELPVASGSPPPAT